MPHSSSGFRRLLQGSKGSIFDSHHWMVIVLVRAENDADSDSFEDSMPTMTAPSSSQQLWQFETPVIGGIVVGFDGSPASHAAVETAGAIAAARKWPVQVVSVLRPMSSYKLDIGTDQPPSEIEDLRIQLRDAALRDAIGPMCERAEWTRQVVVGSPADAIGRTAEKRAADMIIVGRSDRGVLDRMLGGETTLKVMRSCSVPVLVVDSEMDKPETIVVAVDFGPASSHAAAVAVEMLGDSGTVYLVYVEQAFEVLPDGTIPPEDEAYPGQLAMRFRQLTADLKPPQGVVIESVVLNGSPVPALLEFCEQVGADVLAAGTHGLKGIQRLLLGSVSTALVRNIRKPILIVPSKS
jgi:nucleotide-binding universal stress UspA family protein